MYEYTRNSILRVYSNKVIIEVMFESMQYFTCGQLVYIYCIDLVKIISLKHFSGWLNHQVCKINLPAKFFDFTILNQYNSNRFFTILSFFLILSNAISPNAFTPKAITYVKSKVLKKISKQ